MASQIDAQFAFAEVVSNLKFVVFEDADAEVDEMFRNANKITFHPDTGGEPYKATGFQQWKIQKFLYSPDTPAGSLNHEKHTGKYLNMPRNFWYPSRPMNFVLLITAVIS